MAEVDFGTICGITIPAIVLNGNESAIYSLNVTLKVLEVNTVGAPGLRPWLPPQLGMVAAAKGTWSFQSNTQRMSRFILMD